MGGMDGNSLLTRTERSNVPTKTMILTTQQTVGFENTETRSYHPMLIFTRMLDLQRPT